MALRALCLTSALLFSISALPGQTPKDRIKIIKDLEQGGSTSIPKIQAYFSDPDVVVRVEAVKAIVDIGTQYSLDPLIQATRDNDPEVEIRATDGLVNFYWPGYVKTGLTASIKRVGTSILSHFTDQNDLVIPAYITVRPEVIEALGKLVIGGSSIDARANAARAIGILRGKAAEDQLIQAIRQKHDEVMYEALVALQKIRDPEAAPKIRFLLHDFNPKVQIAALQTTGLLLNHSAIPDIKDVIEHTHDKKVRRAALEALAMLPEPSNRAVYARYINDRDDDLRAAAAEGYARLKDPADLPMLRQKFNSETKMNPRLSLAFACVMLGDNGLSEYSPLRYLVDTLNSKGYKGVAEPFLVELARDPGVRRTLYTAVRGATKDEKIQLAAVFARSGDKETIPTLKILAADPDTDVQIAGQNALRTLQARL
jgi:HEAT repeat protein